MRTLKCAGFKDMLFFHSWSMCMLGCTHLIVSRCVLSPLYFSLSFPFCFHLPPASRTLLDILLPSTSCVSSALATNIPSHISATFEMLTEIVWRWGEWCKLMWMSQNDICYYIQWAFTVTHTQTSSVAESNQHIYSNTVLQYIFIFCYVILPLKYILEGNTVLYITFIWQL